MQKKFPNLDVLKMGHHEAWENVVEFFFKLISYDENKTTISVFGSYKPRAQGGQGTRGPKFPQF